MGEAPALRAVSAWFGKHLPSPIAAASLILIAGISFLDWRTPAGVVVGILLGIPIMLSSISEEPHDVWIVSAASIAGFLAAAALGRGPISPAQVWVPNRILAALSLPAIGVLALILQRRRMEARRSAEASQQASDLNRLLLSLMAHDLRSSLATALQCLDYVAGRGPLDLDLVDDARIRLQRGLGALDGILSVVRPEPTNSRSMKASRSGVELARELETEARAFEREAAARGKLLDVRIEGPEDNYHADGLVLRQAVAILVDNAVRHASPGRISVTGRIEAGEIRLDVTDQGPGLGANARVTEPGSGLGLTLCRSLVHRAGGDLRVARDAPDGTTFSLRLPLDRA